MWQAGELIDRLDDLQEDVARADFADDVTGARRAIDAHADISKRLAKVPVDDDGTKLQIKNGINFRSDNIKSC